MIFVGFMVVGLVVGFAMRASTRGSRVNPGKVASAVVALPAMAFSVARAVPVAGDPEAVGYALGYTVGSALIPLAITSMVWFFMRD